jgi:hypothetical protein
MDVAQCLGYSFVKPTQRVVLAQLPFPAIDYSYYLLLILIAVGGIDYGIL